MPRLILEKDALLHNTEFFKSLSPRLIAVLKGNGYGLSLLPYSRILREAGVDFFAVSALSEALALREDGYEGDLLLLSETQDEEEAALIVEREITATVGSEESAALLCRMAKEQEKTALAHLKLDCGFGRFGFLQGEEEKMLSVLRSENISFIGVYAHLSASFGDGKSARAQFEQFQKITAKLTEEGMCPPMRHIANTCGALQFPEMRLDAVRIGSGLLGRLPIPDRWGLKRLGELESRVVCVRTLPKGHNIGYGDTCKTKRETKIAVIPVGYQDGFGVTKENDTFRFLDILRYIYGDLRSWRRKKTVSCGGKVLPLLGRVGMYNIVADATGTEIKAGDSVTLSCNPLLVDSAVEREWR